MQAGMIKFGIMERVLFGQMAADAVVGEVVDRSVGCFS